MDLLTLQQIGLSLGLGFLLGLERERNESSIAGIRTFPLIAVLGTVCAQIGQIFGGWIVAVGLLAVAVVLISANHAKLKNGDTDPGITTEIAALLLFAVGALIVVGSMLTAVVLGGAMAVLLHLKSPLHRFASAMGPQDMHAIMQFVMLSLVILPVLPHENYGPYEVWNPFKLWLMVVLIVGISLGGYVAFKLFGARAGAILGAVIGGIVSSTATTVSFAKRTAGQATLAPLGVLVIMIASCLSFTRVIIEIAAVAPGSFLAIAPPLLTMLGLCCVIAVTLFFTTTQSKTKMPAPSNPAELKAALIFGALYAVVILAVAAAKDHFGDAGLYVVGVISGMTDMDAITLSAAGLANSGSISPDTAWRTILIASMANFVFKWGIVATIGSKVLAIRVGLAFLLALAGGGCILWLWPGVENVSAD